MPQRVLAMCVMMAIAAVLVPVAPAQAELSKTEVVLCRDVLKGDPVGSGAAFTGTDPQVCVHVTLFDVSLSHLVRYEISRPDGSLYETGETRTEAAPTSRYYPQYRLWYCFFIADHEPAFTVGEWSVKVLIDRRVASRATFQILSEGVGGPEKMRERLETLQSRVDANPTDSSARVDLAEAHLRLNELDEAKAELTRAVDLEPRWATPYALLGYVYRRQGNLDDAERSLLQAVGLQDDYSWAHFQLGAVYKEKGETAKAIEQFRRVVQMEGATSLRKDAEEELAKLGAL
jgi:tetratricopeptide (TPR) repeat protein